MYRKFQYICKFFNFFFLFMFFLVFYYKIKKKKILNKNDLEQLELYVLGLLDKKEGCVCNCLLINMNIEYCINILYKIFIKNIFINNM